MGKEAGEVGRLEDYDYQQERVTGPDPLTRALGSMRSSMRACSRCGVAS